MKFLLVHRNLPDYYIYFKLSIEEKADKLEEKINNLDIQIIEAKQFLIEETKTIGLYYPEYKEFNPILLPKVLKFVTKQKLISPRNKRVFTWVKAYIKWVEERDIIESEYEIYQQYLEISYKDYRKIVEVFMDEVRNALLLGQEVKLPLIGSFRIESFSFSKRSIDWVKSNKLKELLLKNNELLYNKDTGEGKKWLIRDNEDRLITSLRWLRPPTNSNTGNPFWLFFKFSPSKTYIKKFINDLIGEDPVKKSIYIRHD